MNLPQLFTFDGQARSGKGTIVHAVKRFLQSRDINTMLIDSGQVFRVLVVSAMQHGVDMDSPDNIDRFLQDPQMLDETTALIKNVYHMEHAERDALLYTAQVGHNSAKFGARPLAQEFKDNLLRKWLQDARDEEFRVVLLDGRALEEVGGMLESEGLCNYRIGFYFICNPRVGALRTLGYSGRTYEELNEEEQEEVDNLTAQIVARNDADAERTVHPVVPPAGAPSFELPQLDYDPKNDGREMIIVDTSASMTKEQSAAAFISLFEKLTDI